MENEIDEIQKLKKETELEYMRFITSTFKKASSKSELTSLVEDFLVESFNDPDKRENITFNQANNLYANMSKISNDYSASIFQSVTKQKEQENGLNTLIKAVGESPKEKDVTDKSYSKETIESAKKVLDFLDEVKTIKKSEV